VYLAHPRKVCEQFNVLTVLALSCLAELKESYEREAAELRSQLKQRVDKMTTMMEAAAHQVAQIEELKAELEAVSSVAA